MKNKQNKRKKILYLILAILLLVVSMLCGRVISPAFANTANRVSVLSELEKSEDFDSSIYVNNATDYSITVIQIAESESGKLYVFTYQPCQRSKYLLASYINMALSKNIENVEDNTSTAGGPLAGGGSGFGGGGGSGRSIDTTSVSAASDEYTSSNTNLYSLTLVNSSGVFVKYLVNNVTVSKESVRYYNISAIYRDFDHTIDSATDGNNTIDRLAYPVRNVFRVETVNGELRYHREETYVVNILNPYVDFLTYSRVTPLLPAPPVDIIGGFRYYDSFDNHYIAFSTDWDIDTLMSARVSYSMTPAKGRHAKAWTYDFYDSVEYGSRTTTTTTVSASNKFEAGGFEFWKYNKYEWNEIQTVDEFISNEATLKDTTKSILQDKQWVLRFENTERVQFDVGTLGVTYYDTSFTVVDKVTILSLEFESNGIVYNLGAVSDTVSGDSLPGNDVATDYTTWDFISDLFAGTADDIPYWVWIIIALLILIIALPILSVFFPIVGEILKWILKGVVELLKGVWWLICLPFKGIAALYHKIRGE